jgi:hypothetical protein
MNPIPQSASFFTSFPGRSLLAEAYAACGFFLLWSGGPSEPSRVTRSLDGCSAKDRPGRGTNIQSAREIMLRLQPVKAPTNAPLPPYTRSLVGA